MKKLKTEPLESKFGGWSRSPNSEKLWSLVDHCISHNISSHQNHKLYIILIILYYYLLLYYYVLYLSTTLLILQTKMFVKYLDKIIK